MHGEKSEDGVVVKGSNPLAVFLMVAVAIGAVVWSGSYFSQQRKAVESPPLSLQAIMPGFSNR